ncbi:MAG: hypothetical protein HYZ50_09725 [Deltaproteobacteria bacterium]|nr:hypothetical protein [Deltaproteobacteria bacterium]
MPCAVCLGDSDGCHSEPECKEGEESRVVPTNSRFFVASLFRMTSLQIFVGEVSVLLLLIGLASAAFAQSFSSSLGISLSELQAALAKGGDAIAFAPRPGSASGTQEAKLPGNSGVVQAAGSPGNLKVIVFWTPVDAQGRLVGVKGKLYLDVFLRLFTDEPVSVSRWVEQSVERAAAEQSGKPSLDSRLVEDFQLKVSYIPSLSPPMFSVTVEAAQERSRG